MSFWLGYLINELPLVGLVWLGASTAVALLEGDVTSSAAWVVVGLAVVTASGLVMILRRGTRARPALEGALDAASGNRSDRSSRLHAVAVPRSCRVRSLLAPLPVRPRSVVRTSDVAYGDGGRGQMLDLYRPRQSRPGAPVLVHFHGGTFRGGNKSHEARPMLHRMAARGWIAVSANYRLAPSVGFPEQLTDAKRVLTWVRAHADELGADPDLVFVAGSSAGAHLAAMVALTRGDVAFQAGFEDADTSVTGVIALYGYYGPAAGTPGSGDSPLERTADEVPPVLVVHGDRDTIAVVQEARQLAGRLRELPGGPVVYAELPGGQHVFDMFHSLRCDAVVDAVEAFTAGVVSARTHRRV